MRALPMLLVFAVIAAQHAEAAVNAVAPAVMDTWVTPANPKWSAGSTAQELSSGPGEIFLQFRLPAPAVAGGHSIRTATLVGRKIAFGGDHAVSMVEDDAWSERVVTWETRPSAAPAPLGMLPPFGYPALLSFDVTEVARQEQLADGVLSLRIAAVAGANPHATFFAREGSEEGFHLDLDLEPAPRLETGDVVLVEATGGVIAITPTTQLRKPLSSPVRMGLPQTVAIDPRDETVLTYDPGARAPILRIDPIGGSTTAIDPQIPAECGLREGFAVDSLGAIFVVARCPDGAVLFRIDPDGTQRAVSRAGLLRDPASLVVDSGGALLAASRDRIVRIDVTTGAQTILSAGGLLSNIYDITVGADAVWVLDDGCIVRVDAITGEQSSEAGCASASYIRAMADGRLLLGGPHAGGPYVVSDIEIAAFDPITGESTVLFQQPEGGVGGFARLADGTFVVALEARWSGWRLSYFDPANGEETPFATPLAALAKVDPDLALDAQRRLLHYGGEGIVRIDPANGAQETLAADLGEHVVRGSMQAGQFFRDIGGGLFFAQRLEQPPQTRILSIDAGGQTSLVREIPIALNSVIAEDAGHWLGTETEYIAEYPWIVGRIWRIDRSTGAAELVLEDGWLMVWAPDLALDGAGGAYVVTRNSGAVLRVDLTTGAQSSAYLLAPSEDTRIDRAASGLFYIRGLGVAEFDPATGLFGGQTIVQFAEMDHEGVAFCVVPPRCSDGWDNDGDGAVDYPADRSCRSPQHDRETSPSCGLGAEIAIALGALTRFARCSRSARSRAH